MIRPMRDEVERYGHYSLAAESQYDHPFQWGSKRTGPDLARVGNRYSDDWHVDHLRDPQSVVPESVMPKYGFLENRMIEGEYMGDLLKTHAFVGVPYNEEMVASAQADFLAQADPDSDYDGLLERYGENVNVRNFDGQPGISEADALIAYLQMLGTLVDFSTFTADASR
jgi:cytochrome c oxidase cbb3-type subunit 2